MTDHPLADAIERGVTWCDENNVPVPKYTLVVKITANSREEVSNRVRSLDVNWDYEYRERDEIDSTDGTTTVLMRHTNPTQTPHDYAEALSEWRKARRAERLSPDMPGKDEK